ncbi:MAG: AI-2E family transporter, partial [Candidatus Daviesbacteria bacterium]|nr:AI-2E family transporter [Candidatus Daviesbacteria bacterium]
MPEPWDKRAKQLLVIAGILFLIFVGLRFARFFADIFIILGLSILIAYLLIGPVDFLTKIVRFRSVAVVLVYLFLIGFAAAILIFVAPKVTKEFGEFTRQIPDILASLDSWIHKIQVYLNQNN